MATSEPVTKFKTVDRISRPQHVADQVKAWIVDQALSPGDRLPTEAELIDHFQMSKGTIREAIRLLEAQGLVKTRTGPGGGAFINSPSELRTQSLLANYFHFKDLSIEDIYELRQNLEPELAASLAPIITRRQIRALEDIMDSYIHPPANAEEERAQHIASLEFHACMASFAKNQLLGFIIRFLTNILAEQTVHKKLFDPEDAELWQKGREFQVLLLDAFRRQNADDAKKIMAAHMNFARTTMNKREIKLRDGLL